MYKWLCLITLVFCQIAVSAEQDIVLDNLWIRQGPPNSKVVSGYLTIQNNQSHEVILSKVNSDQFSSVEFHLTRIVDGVAKMRRKKHLVIPAESSVELKPGSYHLMLFNPKSSLITDMQIPLTFQFQDQYSITVAATVKK